jgi:hypothetical protein
MTVKLLRAFAGLPAGSAYSGEAEVEADLVACGNAVEDVRSVHAEPAAAPAERSEPEPPFEPEKPDA